MIIEEYLQDIIEVNCSAIRVGDEIKVSKCEQISNANEIFDFNTKYLNPTSGFIKKGTSEQEEFTEIQELTRKAYELFNASGVIRADFIIANGKTYLNEINTVPGFLAYHLWARAGVPYGVLIDWLVKNATKPKNVITDFKSDILQKNCGLLR